MLLRVALRSKQLRQIFSLPWRPAISLRSFASPASLNHLETVTLKVGGNGSINLTITKPSHPDRNNTKTKLTRNILVRLPPGPFPNDHISQHSTLSDPHALSEHLPDTTIIDVSYRLSRHPSPHAPEQERDDRFPTAIHDVFTAWAYITGLAHDDSKICLTGEHIGGALTLSLALTDPARVHAVAVQDPLVDWVGLDELAATPGAGSEGGPPKKRSTKHGERDATAAAAKALVNLRTRLFRTPSGYFDGFASPVLFLRAPGVDVPLGRTAAPVDLGAEVVEGTPMRYGEEEGEVGVIEDEGQKGGEHFGPYDDDWYAVETRRIRDGEYRRDGSSSSSRTASPSTEGYSVGSGRDSMSEPESGSTSTDGSTSLSAPVEPPRRRKVLRRWPPNAQPGEVLLPHVNVFLTKPLIDKQVDHGEAQPVDITPVTWVQGRELGELLKRACFWGREKGFAEERVSVTENEPAKDFAEKERQIIEWLRVKFKEVT